MTCHEYIGNGIIIIPTDFHSLHHFSDLQAPWRPSFGPTSNCQPFGWKMEVYDLAAGHVMFLSQNPEILGLRFPDVCCWQNHLGGQMTDLPPKKGWCCFNCKACWILVEKVWIRFCPLPIFHLITGVDHCDPLRTYGEITAFTGAQQNALGGVAPGFFRPDVAISHGFLKFFLFLMDLKCPKNFGLGMQRSKHWIRDPRNLGTRNLSKSIGQTGEQRMGWQIPFLESFLQTESGANVWAWEFPIVSHIVSHSFP